MPNIYTFLKNNNITYQRFDHPAVFTCEDAKKLCPPMPGVSIKNLFLYDKYTDEHFLIVIGDDKPLINMKELKSLLEVSHLSFAPVERLEKYLGVEPGSVTILGLINDIMNFVTVIFDINLKNKALQCHPLINTATLVIPSDDVTKFLALTKHDVKFLDIPIR